MPQRPTTPFRFGAPDAPWPDHDADAAPHLPRRPHEQPTLAHVTLADLAAAIRRLRDVRVLGNPHHEPQPAGHARSKAREAAVLLGCVLEHGAAIDDPHARVEHVLLVERSASVRFAGHLAFPGGHREPFESSPTATALREAHEEIGLAAADVRVLGALPPYYSHAGHCIAGVVAAIDPRARFALDPSETASLIRLPARHAFDPATYRLVERSARPYRANFHARFTERGRDRVLGGPTVALLIHLYDALARVASTETASGPGTNRGEGE